MKHAFDFIAITALAGGMAATSLFGELIQFEPEGPQYLVDRGYDAAGIFYEELVLVLDATPADAFVSAYSIAPPQNPMPVDAKHAPHFAIVYRGQMPVVALVLPLGSDWVDAPVPMMAGVNGDNVVAGDGQEVGFWARNWAWAKANPGKALLAGTAAFFVADYIEDGSINFFGLRKGGDSSAELISPPPGSTNPVYIQGEGNTVTVVVNHAAPPAPDPESEDTEE